MSYTSPIRDFLFILNQVTDFSDVVSADKYTETTPDLVEAILGEAGKLCDEVLAPLNRAGDLSPAVLENGVVRTSPGFDDGFRAIAEGGWIGLMAGPDHGGMGLPVALGTALNDMMSGACLALQLNPLLTQGQIEALEAHADENLRSIYLPKLISGAWSGTMNLTEPHAGSDVGALSSRAVPNGDGTYAISGQKIFITWGDADFMENICHLVLARLPDAPAGTKGISLFLVPKFLPDDTGAPGRRNSLRVVSLEHKMGLHGSPTAVMEYDGATGWMVGAENGGMAAMFTMMNSARLGVGTQAIGVAEAAYQHALSYARERKQGKADGTGTIIEHADVRRMLTSMKADIFAARSIALSCAVAIDMAKASGSPEWIARAALLTPIAKAFGTETGIAVAELGIQVHGGMGFIEETGAAQFLRDVRVTSIYEGTNGIQAMDLVGRKMMDGGDAMYRILDEIETVAEQARAALPDLAGALWAAAETHRECTEWLVEQSLDERFGGAVAYLQASARVLGGYYHLKAALAEPEGRRRALAHYYMTRHLPEHSAFVAQVQAGTTGLYDLSVEDLAL